MKKYFSDCISKEVCNDLYKKLLLNDDTKNKNKYFSKNIQDILKEMYVDDTFVTACQHMIELCGKNFFIVYDSQRILRDQWIIWGFWRFNSLQKMYFS